MTLLRTGLLIVALVVTAVLALGASPALAQAGGVPQWTASMGGGFEDAGSAIAVGPGGSVVVVGSFQGSADFDPGPGTKVLTAHGSTDAFIAKLTTDGALVWAVALGGAQDTFARDVAIDPQGDIYVVGTFSGYTDFDPGAQEYVLTSNGSTDVFLMRLDPFGKTVWAGSFGESESDDGEAIYIDSRNHIYITGGFEKLINVNLNTSQEPYWLSSKGDDDIFIARYYKNGGILRGWALGGGDDAMGRDIMVDEAWNVYIAGTFEGKVDFSPGEDYVVRSAGHEDIFLTKFNDGGGMEWTSTFGGRQKEKHVAISMDALGNIYMTGSFQSAADFDPGDGEYILNSIGESDIFLVKLNTFGGLIWANGIGGVRSDFGEGIVAGNYGDIFVTGTFEESVDFDPGPGTVVLNGRVEEDIFLARYSAGGRLYSVQAMSGVQEENGRSVALDPQNAVYVAGGYENTVDFNVGANAELRTAIGARDVYVTKRLYPASPFGEPSVFLPAVSVGSPALN